MPEPTYKTMMREASTRTCPVCKQLVRPTVGGKNAPNVLKHTDTTGVTVCPMSGNPFELTYPVQGAVPAARVVA